MTPHEILIRPNDVTPITGAHSIDKPGDLPRPVKIEDAAAFGPDLNAAAIAAPAEHQRIRDELAQPAGAALAAGDLAALRAIVADAQLFGAARGQAKLATEAAAKRAEADALEAKLAAL